MRNPEVLVVDDTTAIRTMMKAFLEEEHYTVFTARSGEEALALLREHAVDLVMLDIKLEKKSGLDVLLEIKKTDHKLPVVVMTAYGTTQTTIEAMKRGAYDYITKPFDNRKVKEIIRSALAAGRLMKEEVQYQCPADRSHEGVCIVGESPLMQDVYKIIGQVAESNATVLIRGESGTGKELAARAIYQHSLRKDKPFLEVNCAAIPEALLESELFGHEKGAFTGAINRRIGKFQQCHEGTIFLDEIGDMAPSLQTKILRVLQEHTFQPVGSEKTVHVDVRVIASTNKDLEAAIETGDFREDLFYRLNVVTITLPALRERREDIPLLIDYFIRKFSHKHKKRVRGASDELKKILGQQYWKGNVRELENVIQTAVIMCKGDVLVKEQFPLQGGFSGFTGEVPDGTAPDEYGRIFREMLTRILDDVLASSPGAVYKRLMGEFERVLITMVMSAVSENQVHAARLLGISRNTLRARLQYYDPR